LKHDDAPAVPEAGPSTTPAGPTIAASKKAKAQQPSRKKRMKSELGKEKAMEREAITQERVKGREEKKVSYWSSFDEEALADVQAKRNRAKKAWE
jgi:hypothetical protein